MLGINISYSRSSNQDKKIEMSSCMNEHPSFTHPVGFLLPSLCPSCVCVAVAHVVPYCTSQHCAWCVHTVSADCGLHARFFICAVHAFVCVCLWTCVPHLCTFLLICRVYTCLCMCEGARWLTVCICIKANCSALAGVQEPTGNAAVYLQYECVSLTGCSINNTAIHLHLHLIYTSLWK